MEDRKQSSEEGRYTVSTKQGLIDQDVVAKYKEAHYQALKQPIPKDPPIINSMATNQTQEYFAIATEQGFEIL
jgi:hypothetical protein